ncbi:hypothetical protein TTHERM_00105490 (macronuclear) [Tetrahymena thermophila SB210]|uniref:Uncharacterized protein n=1 Tax=Tetrahymena thermophila (strain SB210) TaxID=312017 RepID=Q234E9_TETTS|nr:hypothetical protein TTHERM_00105490 [Tetrahymena thermophila SB210]EAR92054.1 hypothetical protein TTHERM_00105490 [Tetrahymena thermophila SB210]|eukprot:XP_001012299.1 hypothetical protein TTHERM_00105490 [Tetrahymena thermophila SB210]
MSVQKKYSNKCEGINKAMQNDFTQNYQSIYNREDFTLTEIVDMEKQIQRLKILFEFFDIWESGLAYREQKEEELKEKFRQSEQVSFCQLEEEQTNRSQKPSGRGSERQQSKGIQDAAELEEIQNLEKMLFEREKQLNGFEQDLNALKQEIVKKNAIVEQEFYEVQIQKDNLIHQNQESQKDLFNDQMYLIKQQELDYYIKQEESLESRFASLNEKEQQTEQEQVQLQEQCKEIEDSKRQIEDKKKELAAIELSMMSKHNELIKELEEAQKKLEAIAVQVDCVQNQQSSLFYKEKLENRDKLITENEQKLAVREDLLQKEIAQLKLKCSNLNIPINNIKFSEESLLSKRCNTDSFFDLSSSNIPNPKQIHSFRNSNNTTSTFVQTPPNGQNISFDQMKLQIKKQSQDQVRSRENQFNLVQNDQYCDEIKLIRGQSQPEKDRSPVNNLKMKLSSRKKELSAFLSPTNQHVKNFEASFQASKVEFDTSQVEVHQSYQNGYEIFNAPAQQKNILHNESSPLSNLNDINKNSFSPQNDDPITSQVNNQQNMNLSSSVKQVNVLKQENYIHQANVIQQEQYIQTRNQSNSNQYQLNHNKVISQQQQNQNIGSQNETQSHQRSGSITMQEKILQQMKLNQSSSSKIPQKRNSVSNKNQSQSETKSQIIINQQKLNKIALPQSQNIGAELKEKVSEMTNSQKIKNKILKLNQQENQFQQTEQQFTQNQKDFAFNNNKEKTNLFSFKKIDNNNQSQASMNSSRRYEKSSQPNTNNHNRTFSFANVGTSQELISGSDISYQQSLSNFLKNSSNNTSFQPPLKNNTKINTNSSLMSERKNSQRDENVDPKNQISFSGQKIRQNQINNQQFFNQN